MGMRAVRQKKAIRDRFLSALKKIEDTKKRALLQALTTRDTTIMQVNKNFSAKKATVRRAKRETYAAANEANARAKAAATTGKANAMQAIADAQAKGDSTKPSRS